MCIPISCRSTRAKSIPSWRKLGYLPGQPSQLYQLYRTRPIVCYLGNPKILNILFQSTVSLHGNISAAANQGKVIESEKPTSRGVAPAFNPASARHPSPLQNPSHIAPGAFSAVRVQAALSRPRLPTGVDHQRTEFREQAAFPVRGTADSHVRQRRHCQILFPLSVWIGNLRGMLG